MPSSNRDPFVGTLLADRFHVKRPLASGGMADVYVARDGEGGPRVALKILREGAEARLVRLMQREGESLLRLHHPNIVAGVGHGPHGDGGYWVAMELVEGESLTRWVRKHDPSVPQRVRLMRKLLEALRAVHAAGLVHRDLKSSNILVSGPPGAPDLHLLDFGVVLVDGTSEAADEHLLGGIHTTSPEQIQGESVDARADLYSFGVLLHRVLGGRYPYHSKVPAEVLGKHLHAEIPRLSDEIDPDLRAVVERCLQKRPEDRYPDATSLLDALDAVGGTEAPRTERNGPALVPVIAGFLLLGIALAGYFVAC